MVTFHIDFKYCFCFDGQGFFFFFWLFDLGDNE